MIEGIIQIGQALLEGGDLLSNLIREVPSERMGKRLHVLKLNFDVSNTILQVDVKEEMDENSTGKYLFVGSADGPNSPQWFASSSSLNYFLTETVPNLADMDLGVELNDKIKKVLDSFFLDLGEGINRKYRYALNLKKFNIADKEVTELYEKALREVTDSKKVGKELVKSLLKEFNQYLSTEFDINQNDIGLYVLLIDGKPLVEYGEYTKAVLEAKKPKPSVTKGKKVQQAVCSICGSHNNITDDLTKMKVKFYTTNQIIFASSLDKKNYCKNFQVCGECLNRLLSGETYVTNNLNTKLADFNVYIIPHFVYGQLLDKNELEQVKDRINFSFNTVKNIEDVKNFRNEIVNNLDLKNEDSYFLLNFMFYKTSNLATKIQRLIKDINPSVFERIGKAIFYAISDMKQSVSDNLKVFLGLETVYYMIPTRVKKGQTAEFRDVLNLYDAIFTSKRVNRQHIISNIVNGVKVIALGKEGYNLSQHEKGIEFYIIRSNAFLRFLEHLGCLKEGSAMNVSELSIKDKLKNYIGTMGYNEQQSAMFILGYLIGEIGNAQHKRLDGEKPILNKLNFNGIDKAKVKRLVNDVYNKLNQEKSNDKKLRVYHETEYFELKKLLDANFHSWKLNKSENLFYILSGYSFATVQPILKEGK
ncbi:MAG: CRISPR-associated protein, Csd1 family [Firmicutes bacterium]|nr:CRISPR-associated protein, Csd1 family [Bacillota bacterium]